MIYLLSTNRPEWAEYAYRQFLRFLGCILVVLDNTEHGIPYWKEKANYHYHIPQCENVSQMFNWFLENHPDTGDLFYADDDMEYRPDIQNVMQGYLKTGYDLVVNPKMYVSNDVGSSYFIRKPWNVGAGWMISKDVLKLWKFREDTIEGSCDYLRTLQKFMDVNTKTIYYPLVNLIVHNNNMVQKKEDFKFELPRVDWDNN